MELPKELHNEDLNDPWSQIKKYKITLQAQRNIQITRI